MELDQHSLEQHYAYPTSPRPWIRTNFVTTLDGAAHGTNGRSGPLGSADDKRAFALLRSLADIIIVGAGTARTESYAPITSDEIDGDLRNRLGLAPIPPIAVVSRSLNIPVALMVPGQIVITTEDTAPARLAAVREHVEVIAAGRNGVIDWPQVVNLLHERGLNRVLCEGGPSLHGTLIAGDLVDELCLTITPMLAAGSASRIAHNAHAVEHPMNLAHSIRAGDLLLTRYVRERR